MLTVIIPCKDEIHNIQACVASARLLQGEILVADSGSTDGTLDLVRSMSDCRLVQREFINYADFKNWAIPQAGRPWVFVLDADERITPELAREVRQTLAAASLQTDAYWIPRQTFFLGRQVRFGPWLNDGVHRLFRRDRCRYRECRVHESLLVERSRSARLRNKLLHYTVNSYDEYFAKYINYTRWGAADRWERGIRTTPVKMFTRPMFRFLWLYLARGGFLDGAVGLQACMLQAFFVTFVKQGRLWELELGDNVPEQPNAGILPFPTLVQSAIVKAARAA
jgi:glycosyltransferase involved in cell wall biosynthesis